jgi:hypothetical protein
MRMPWVSRSLTGLVLAAVLCTPVAFAASTEELEQKLRALQEQVDVLRRQLEETKSAPVIPAAPVPAAPVAETPPPPVAKPSWLSDFRIGGYGSTRFEANDLKGMNNTFTFRRFVLTGDATVGERLRSVVEIELERLNELQVERKQPVEGGLRGFSQSIEGSDGSEVSLEQAWMQFSLTDWAKLRAGMILVPLGRFNINHDDNRWDLPRRSLVDRGVSVLPAQAAWSEVGMGFTGDIALGDAGRLTYEAYAMNGVTLDATIETVVRPSGELEAGVEITPRRGTANLDFKNEKAGAVRVAWSPALGEEFGLSGYAGRYTPAFLPSETLWALAFDGKMTFGSIELEGEYVRAQYEGIRQVARGLALHVVESSLETGTAPLGGTIEFELAGLATTKQGYWLELRYRFWPDVLRDSILGRKLENPQLVATARWEQVWLTGLVREATFSGGALKSFAAENRFVNRATIGLAYRPVPLVVFQTAYERTWTDSAQSLSAVTNFLVAGPREDTANAFLFGVAFGF